MARLDPEPGAHQPLRTGRQLLHQHRHLLLEGREVPGHHADHHEDQGTRARIGPHDHGHPQGKTLQVSEPAAPIDFFVSPSTTVSSNFKK